MGQMKYVNRHINEIDISTIIVGDFNLPIVDN